MDGRSRTFVAALAGAVVAAVSGACRGPTQITLEITTDARCEDVRGTAISIGDLGAYESRPASALTPACDSTTGRIGSIVIVPSGEADGQVAMRLVMGFGRDPAECVPPAYGPGCIVARRMLRFIPSESLLVPVFLGAACNGVPCDATTTCTSGQCSSAVIEDPSKCLEPVGCGESALGAATPAPPAPPAADGGASVADASSTDASPACTLGDGGAGVLCGGSCVDLRSDRLHCGACGNACAATDACEGTCVAVATSLVALRYEWPCLGPANVTWGCSGPASPPASKSAVITGTAGRSYLLDVRVRGVVEAKTYTGTTAGAATGTNASLFVKGGTVPDDGWNSFTLAIGAPAATYRLNAGTTGVQYAFALDYRTTLRASASSTLVLGGASSDVYLVKNIDQSGAPISIAGTTPSAYDGQFVQIDVESVRPAP